MEGFIFTKDNGNKLFTLDTLKLTDAYALKVVGMMAVGENVMFKEYSLKRVK